MESLRRETAQEILKDYQALMNVKEVAEALRCVTKTVRNLISEGHLECTRIGRIIYVPKDSVLEYLCRPIAVGQYRPKNSKYEKERLEVVKQTAKAPENVEPDDDEWRALKSAAEKLGYDSVLVRAYNIVKRSTFSRFGDRNATIYQIPREEWAELRNCGKKTLELLYEAFPEKAIQ